MNIAEELTDLKTRKEETFTASAEGDIASGGTLNIRLQNPSDSGVELYVYFGEVTHEGQMLLEIWDEVSSVTGGSPATVNNNYIGSSNATSATVEQDVSFTGDNLHQSRTYVGTSTHIVFNGYKIFIPEGEEIVVEITDESGGNDEVGLTIAYAEIRA